jgi:hypothetical protein
MLTPFLYSIPITDTPEIDTTIQNLDTAERQRTCIYCKIALLLTEEGIELNQKFLLSSPFAPLGDRLGRTAVHAVSADLLRFCSSLPAPPFLAFPLLFLFSCQDDALTLAT